MADPTSAPPASPTPTPSSAPILRDPEAYALTLPLRFRTLYLRATQGSKPAARKCMCLECQGWQEGAVKAIRMCPSRACPNWAVRPYQDPGQDGGRIVSEERQEAIRRAREAREANRQGQQEETPEIQKTEEEETT